MKRIIQVFKENPLLSWTCTMLLALFLVAGFNFSGEPRETATTRLEDLSLSPSPSEEKFVRGQVMVKFKSEVSQTVIDQKLQQYDARIIDSIEKLHYFVLEVPPGMEKEVVKKLIEDGIATSADLNYEYEERLIPNDTQFESQYGLTIIQAPQAWDVTRGKGVIIANLEPGGADIRHPDLAPNVVMDGSVYGAISHGTHTAGIIAGAGNNGQGISGTCPDCKLLMLSMKGYNDAGVSQAIVTAADKGAKAISMSFGGPKGGQILVDAVKYAWDKGCIPVAASGNDNKLTLGGPPGSLQYVVNVAATNATDKKASFSNYHKDMTIAAPGDKILSTIPGGKYGNNSGTSMSAPMVAGVVGLIWSTSYGTSPQAVVDRLCSTSDKITGTGTQWKCGRVNAFKAVQGGNAVAQPAPTQPAAPQPTIPPVVKPTAGATDAPRETVAKPTFTSIGDCVTNNNCPPTDIPNSDPKQIAQLPEKQHPALTHETPKEPAIPTKDTGLLQLLIELILQIVQLLVGRR